MWGFVGASVVVAAAAAGGFFARSAYEKKHFKVDTYTIETDKLQTDEKRFVFLTDLHSNVFGLDNRPLIEAIDKINPDFILSGGDMMVVKGGEADAAVSLRLFKELTNRYPVYAANGNHETRMRKDTEYYKSCYADYTRQLERMGVRVLVDEALELEDGITISGVELCEEYYRDFCPAKLHPAFLEERLGKADAGRFQILMPHSPLFFDAYRQWGADLSLAGHFHGGTIRLPVLGGVMTPQIQFFHPKCAGFFQQKGKYLLVGRGLGTHSVNIRFNNLPQLAVVVLKNPG